MQQQQPLQSVVFNGQGPPQQPMFSAPMPPKQHQQQGNDLQFYNSGYTNGGSYGTANHGNNAAAQLKTSSSAYSKFPDEGRQFVGSPFGSAGYSDEPPLCEGMCMLVINRRTNHYGRTGRQLFAHLRQGMPHIFPSYGSRCRC